MRKATIVLMWLYLPAIVAAAQGAQVSEPGLAGRSDIIFFEDWDSPNWQSHWRGAHDRGYQRIEGPLSFVMGEVLGKAQGKASNVFFGPGSLECEHTTGTHNPSEMTAIIPGQDVAYIRWYRKWENDYDWTQHKMPGFYARSNPNSGGGAGEKPTGTDKFSAKLFVGWNRAPAIYPYHPEQEGPYGDHLRQNIGPTVFLETGRWYCFELMLKANNPPARDGEIKMWINGELKAHYKDMRFRDTPELKINLVTHSAYVGGTWVSKRKQHLWDDNLVVAANYIGPMKFTRKMEEDKPKKARETVAEDQPKGPPREVLDALDAARRTALAGDFEVATEMLAEDIEKIDKTYRPLLEEAHKAFSSVENMKTWVTKAVGEGRHEHVFVDLMDRPLRVLLVAADEEGIKVDVAGSTFPLAWQQLSLRRLMSVFKRYMPEGKEPNEQLSRLLKALNME